MTTLSSNPGSPAISGSSIQPVSPAHGNAQLELMQVLGDVFKMNKKDQDSQPSPMIAYVEEAFAQATSNMTFEARQAYWKSMLNNMQNVPSQLLDFFQGQNDLFNNNTKLQELQKELEKVQSECKNDQKSQKAAELTAKIAFATAGALVAAAAIAAAIPIAGPFIAAGFLIAAGVAAAVGISAQIAAGIYSSKVSVEEGQIKQDQAGIKTMENEIESQSQALAGQMNSGAEKVISNSQQTSDALIGVLQTATSVAKQVGQNNAA